MSNRNSGARQVSRRGFARLGVSAAAAVVAAATTARIAGAAPATPTWPSAPSSSAPSSEPTSEQPSTTEAAPAQPAPPVETETGWVALADDATKQLTIWNEGEVVATMPISMGSDRFPTPNGTYHTMEKRRDMIMSSATYGVPVDSPDGYETYVEYATRMSWSGIFVHAAPWSEEQQGFANVSHGCINVSTENGKFIYDNFPIGTPIVVQNTIGPDYIPGS